ncbi:D-alanyl-D-alanine carboxypeptidase family protein [Paenibacillus hunanensis]|uniref:M15 family metallopeptidase n=1 Tax=Paenibacillus hunanensis TaxID=539262 RepID=UPI00202696C2|nr:M15 family metallopeptidase [Paenibacillus hunanensis]MCL9660804.1 D-alanyl-D-alanine carboxypeptidase family protein [Paenibacillus hunanensis]
MNKSTSWKWAVPAGILMSGMIFAGCAGNAQNDTGAAAQQGSTTESTQTGSTDATDNTGTTDNTNGSEQATDHSQTSGGQSDSSASSSESSGQTSTGNTDSTSSEDANTDSSNTTNTSATSGDASSLLQIREKSSLQSTISEKGGKMVVNDPESITVIVNKKRSLPDGYIPPDLVVPNVAFSYSGVLEKSHMRKEAAAALEQLFAASKKDGLDLRAVSGYRSYKRQVAIYKNNVATKGQEYTDRVSARPGTSEHQTGLAIDVSGPGIGYGLEQSFGATKEGKWLKEHAPEYGFVIRYTENGESSTGYTWEPWHIRYIGKALAEDVTSKGMTLEQYFDEKNIKS